MKEDGGIKEEDSAGRCDYQARVLLAFSCAYRKKVGRDSKYGRAPLLIEPFRVQK